MRRYVLTLWLLLPIGGWAFHEGPGQELVTLDEADAVLRDADALAASEDWAAAVTRYEDALKLLPVDRVAEARRVRLELNKARMHAAGLPQAHADLRALVDEMELDAVADPDVRAGARTALASAQYYMTWLLRLEGMPREKWEPEIEASRQNYRLLAERAAAAGRTAEAEQHRADLESAVRLARIEIKDLQGLPLPSQ